VASWIVLGVGGAALASFALLGGLALAEDGALDSRCGTSCSRADVGTLEGLTTGADVSLTAGLVLVAVGVVLALVTDDGSAEHAGLELGRAASARASDGCAVSPPRVGELRARERVSILPSRRAEAREPS
jgi:hypothetical protein